MIANRSTRDLVADAIRESKWRGKDTPGELADAALAVLGVEWGLRIDRLDHIRKCSEHTAWLAAPDETSVSRVVGAWQEAQPKPPAAVELPN